MMFQTRAYTPRICTPGFQKIMITPLAPKLRSTYEPESAAYTTRRAGWELPLQSSTAFWELKEGLSGVSTEERDKRWVSPSTHTCNWLDTAPSMTPSCTPGCVRGKDKQASVKGAVCPFYYLSCSGRAILLLFQNPQIA
jgi:hypothetical protein